MDVKQWWRGKLAYGFSRQRTPDGEVEGHHIVRISKRNPYELVGLRRPVRIQHLRLKPC